eukprot:gnl/Hemi2/19339_TR6425_c0_g1_i1.p1 gnl/Hemi2/19339_TR6425_c0_g1~~gnl/Hemi2/19339_TR6425_c0_g1_i1.p1  ORF type:complete len:349 (+),score=57.95 gnl/Hemi2/19339_TR6425_c0_g1_i1:106-1152(+)
MMRATSSLLVPRLLSIPSSSATTSLFGLKSPTASTSTVAATKVPLLPSRQLGDLTVVYRGSGSGSSSNKTSRNHWQKWLGVGVVAALAGGSALSAAPAADDAKSKLLEVPADLVELPFKNPEAFFEELANSTMISTLAFFGTLLPVLSGCCYLSWKMYQWIVSHFPEALSFLSHWAPATLFSGVPALFVASGIVVFVTSVYRNWTVSRDVEANMDLLLAAKEWLSAKSRKNLIPDDAVVVSSSAMSQFWQDITPPAPLHEENAVLVNKKMREHAEPQWMLISLATSTGESSGLMAVELPSKPTPQTPLRVRAYMYRTTDPISGNTKTSSGLYVLDWQAPRLKARREPL